MNFETTDIALASYIEVMTGETCDLRKEGKRVIFVFNEDVKNYVDKFYANDGQMLEFANKLRNTKTRIINCL